jgi:hypothetical protein
MPRLLVGAARRRAGGGNRLFDERARHRVGREVAHRARAGRSRGAGLGARERLCRGQAVEDQGRRRGGIGGSG